MRVKAALIILLLTTATESRVFNVAIILNKNDSQHYNILSEATKLISQRQNKKSYATSDGGSSSTLRFTEHHVAFFPATPKTTLQSYLNFTKTFNRSINLVIFMEISKETLVFSQMLHELHIPTIGLQRKDIGALELSSESLNIFTRVPTQSTTRDFAFVIKDVINKMGWRRICLMTTADQEGLEFAEMIQRFSANDSWQKILIMWLDEKIDGKFYQKIVNFRPDVLVVHGRAKNIEFHISKASKFLTCPLIITNSSLLGVPKEKVPLGVLKLSIRRVVHSSHYHPNVQMMSDCVVFVETVFNKTVQELCDNHLDRSECGETMNSLLFRRVFTSHISSFSSSTAGSFFIPGPTDRPTQAFDIWNLQADFEGHTFWLEVGMWTPTGIALDSLTIQNGVKLTPSVSFPKPELRVPVVSVPSWIEVGKPYYHDKTGGKCLNGKLCYTFEKIPNSSVVTRTNHCCVGAMIDLINLLENDLKFKSFIYFTPDKKWGVFNDTTGRWSGLMEQLTTGKGDVTALLGINMARYEDVAFTQPYMDLGMNILVRKKSTPSHFWAINWKFLEPFSLELWLAITGVSNIFLLVIWALDRLSPHGHRRRISLLQEEDLPMDNGFSLLDSMSYVWGVAFSKDIGAENTPRSPSARLVSIFFGFMALILVNTYCANLTAVLMQENFSSPIEGIHDQKLVNPSLFPPDGFQLGVVRDSLEEWYFKTHRDTQMQLLYNVNIKINLVDDYKSGFIQLRNKKLDGLVGDEISLQAQANMANCDYKLIGTKFYAFGVGFAFTKDSPWLHKATLSVLKNQENGTIEQIKKLRFPSKPCQKPTFREFLIDDFSGLFITIVLVIVFGLLTLVVEIFLIYVLIKQWKLLGCFGKKLRYFIFGIKEGDRHLIEIQWLSTFGRNFGKSWEVNLSTPQLSLHNGHNFKNGYPSNSGIKNDAFYISDDISNDFFSTTRASDRSLSPVHSCEIYTDDGKRTRHSSRKNIARYSKNMKKSVRLAEPNDNPEITTDENMFSNATQK